MQCYIIWSVVRIFRLWRVWHHITMEKNAGKWKWSKVKTRKRRIVKWLQKSLNSTVTWPDLSTFSINFTQNTSGRFSLKWLNWFRRTRHTRNVSSIEKYVKSLCELSRLGLRSANCTCCKPPNAELNAVRREKSSNDSYLVHILVLVLQNLLSDARWKRLLTKRQQRILPVVKYRRVMWPLKKGRRAAFAGTLAARN